MMKTLKEQRDNQEERPVEGQQPAVIPELYTNSAMVNFSPFEFEITLGLASSTYQGIRPVVNVRMSPQFAKELARILAENIAAYEGNFGELPVPPRRDVSTQ